MSTTFALPLPARIGNFVAFRDTQLNLTLVDCMSDLQGDYPDEDTFQRAAQEVFSDQAEATCDIENIHGANRDQFMRMLQSMAFDAGFTVAL